MRFSAFTLVLAAAVASVHAQAADGSASLSDSSVVPTASLSVSAVPSDSSSVLAGPSGPVGRPPRVTPSANTNAAPAPTTSAGATGAGFNNQAQTWAAVAAGAVIAFVV